MLQSWIKELSIKKNEIYQLGNIFCRASDYDISIRSDELLASLQSIVLAEISRGADNALQK